MPSPKTEDSGKGHRVIPLFTLLRPHLEVAFEHAEEGSEFVFPHEYRRRAHGPGGWVNANLRTTFEKVVRRAGVEPWPRLWHSLRASCESDLAQSFPLPTVTKWLGNPPSVALRHYVDPTEVAFERAATWVPGGGAKSGAPAAQNAAQQVPAGSRTESKSGGGKADGEAGYASPCDSQRDSVLLSSRGAGNRQPWRSFCHKSLMGRWLSIDHPQIKSLPPAKIRHIRRLIRHLGGTVRVEERPTSHTGRTAQPV